MTLEALNTLDKQALTEALRQCCGSTAWVNKMLAVFPISDKARLLELAANVWQGCTEAHWREAFLHHPKIGASTTNATAAAEQAGTSTATLGNAPGACRGQPGIRREVWLYLYCLRNWQDRDGDAAAAAGRLNNTSEKEITIAMGEQQKIIHIRLEKLLS